ncbi:SDR family NAD(P)-dependent oxidoreductase [Wukongibacter sp. M2B1]|uniref:SDR family NAD(P)-dependent oxidoreductase n=1 Tax=Wukongibacter sp. M2B1 TaxID=3088895 RepID=UPI003D7B7BC3
MLNLQDLDSLSESKKKSLIKLIEEKGSEYGIFPLSAEQERMWFLYQMNPENPYYNATYELKFDGKVNKETVINVMRDIIRRHEVLRTKYVSINGKPYQVIQKKFEYEQKHMDISNMELHQKPEKIREIIRNEKAGCFDLINEIPIRILFLKVSDNEYRLILTLHHITHDGWSIGILIKEFTKMYEAYVKNKKVDLPDINIQYADYSVWQKNLLKDKKTIKQLEFWKSKLKNASHVLKLPKDYDRPDVPAYRGSTASISFEEEIINQLKTLVEKNKSSLYIVLLTMFYALLYRYTGQKNISVGTPIANRQREEFENIFGFFSNSIVINIDCDDEVRFKDLLNEVKDNALEAFSNQDIPFDKVVEALKVERSSNISPLFQTIFTIQNESMLRTSTGEVYNIGDVNISFENAGKDVVESVQFDLIVAVVDKNKSLDIVIGYNTEIFVKERMEAFIKSFKNLIVNILIDPNRPIIEYSLMSNDVMPEAYDKPLDSVLRSYDKELLQEVEIGGKLDEIFKQRIGDGWISVIDDAGNTMPPYFEGNICFLEDKASNKKRWLKTGNIGFWKMDGSLEITYERGNFVKYNNKSLSLYVIEKKIIERDNIRDCKVIYDNTDNQSNTIIYYVSDNEIDVSEFYCYFPEDFISETNIMACKVKYIPVDSRGYCDIKSLERNCGKRLKVLHQSKQVLIENTDKVTIAPVLNLQPQHKNYIALKSLLKSSESEKENLNRKPNLRRITNRDAYLKGKELDELDIRNLGELLKNTCEKYPNNWIKTIRLGGVDTHTTYEDLEKYAACVKEKLNSEGVRQGDKVILQIGCLERYIRVFWGCIMAGVIPVPLAIPKSEDYQIKDAAVERLVKIWNFLDKPLIVAGSDEFHSILKMKDSNGYDDMNILGESDIEYDKNVNISYCSPKESDIALILFTSGSTGIPKGVQLSHRNIIKRSQGTSEFNRFNDKEISLNWMPLDHVGGIVMFHIRDVYNGMRQIQVETQEILNNPLKWMEYIDKYSVNVTWAPNFAYSLIIEKEKDIKNCKWDLSTLRFILNGGEAVNENTGRKFLNILKEKGLQQNVMYPSWGMTETTSGVAFSKRFLKESWNKFVEVGEPIGGVEFRIVNERDEVQKEGEIGRLQVKGETINSGYYENRKENEKTFRPGGWFVTGDLGFIYNGQLTITGRDKDVIIINGINYNCQKIEKWIEDSTKVFGGCTAACGVLEEGSETEKLLIFYSKDEHVDREKTESDIRNVILQRMGLNIDYLIKLTKDEIPRTSIGKIQRKKLKSMFVSGEFNDRINEKKSVIPNWFFKYSWQKVEASHISEDKIKGCYLIFMDDEGLGRNIGKILEKEGNKCFYVYQNKSQAIESYDKNTFFIDSSKNSSYEQLFNFMKDNNVKIDSIVHLWSFSKYKDNENQYEGIKYGLDRGVYSLMNLIQGLSIGDYINRDMKLIVGSSYAVHVNSRDRIISARSTLTGFLRTLQLEKPKIKIKHIDMELTDIDKQTIQLLVELKNLKDDIQIAYRGNMRYKPILKVREMTESQEELHSSFKLEGVYVITGGLGGIGQEVSTYLMEKYKATIIILGRTDFKDGKFIGEEANKKQQAFEKLNSKGTVIYECADISEKGAFEEAVIRLEGKLNVKIDGILHLAGEGNLKEHWEVAEQRWIQNESQSNFEIMYAPKIYGTKEILDFASKREQLDVVLFSSINGIFGGTTFSAYSSANSYMHNVLFEYEGRIRGYNINWSMWEKVGMSEENTEESIEISKKMGYYQIGINDGLYSMDAVLQRDDSNTIVGIDGLNENIVNLYNSDNCWYDYKWDLYYSTYNGKSVDFDCIEYDLINQLNEFVQFKFKEKIPMNDDGSINYEELTKSLDNSLGKGFILPRNETEKRLYDIWKNVIGSGNFSIYDKFFEVGGNSIRSIQLLTQINKCFNVKIGIVDLFKYSSIYDMSIHIESICDSNETVYEEVTAFTF